MSSRSSRCVAEIILGRSSPSVTYFPQLSGSCALPFRLTHRLPSSVADALPVGAETQLGKQEQEIASSGYRDPSGVAAGNEPFPTISITEKTVHNRARVLARS
jgi:hypothetical protein